MLNATKEFFTNYFKFSGRTTRKDYWLAILGLIIISFIISIIAGLIFGAAPQTFTTTDPSGILKEYFSHGANIIYSIWDLILIIPGLAITVRRLHDINKSGFWILLELIPVIGSIIIFIFTLLPAVNDGNNY